MKQRPLVIFVTITLCLMVPLLESLNVSILWGLNLHSPAFMDQLTPYIRGIKIMLVIVALYLLNDKQRELRALIPNVVLNSIFKFFSYGLASCYGLVLVFGILFSMYVQPNYDYIHREKQFNNLTIYVYTLDPGAMGKAYHYFSVKCPLAFNRYKLNYIARTNWMKDFEFNVEENTLIITDAREPYNVTTFDIREQQCD